MTVAKSARNRSSAEQKLVELKRRLREISDLTAAGDVLNWDQATYMPQGGADARGRQCAVLYLRRTSRRSRRHSASCSTRLPITARACRTILTTLAWSVSRAATFKRCDYLDKALAYHSPDPSDPSVPERVITIMLAEECWEMAALLDDTMADEESIVRRAGTPVSRRFLLSPFNWAADSVALLADLDPTVCVELCKIEGTRMHVMALALANLKVKPNLELGRLLLCGSIRQVFTETLGRSPPAGLTNRPGA
jgi:hypothetical protein